MDTFFFLYPMQHFLKNYTVSQLLKSLGLKNLNFQPLNTGPAKQPQLCQEEAEPSCRLYKLTDVCISNTLAHKLHPFWGGEGIIFFSVL